MRLSLETANALVRLANNITSKVKTPLDITFINHVELKKLDNEYLELSATDGHIAVWVKIKDVALASTLLKTPYYFPRENADLLKALIKNAFHHVDFEGFTKDVKFPNMNQFRITDTKWTETIYKEKAPPEIVIDRSFTIGFNIKFMTRIEKAFAPSKNGCVKMTMDTRSKDKPFLIRSNNTEILEEAVVMPMRV